MDYLEENARSYLEKILAILDIEATIVQEDIDQTTTCYRIECKADDARLLIGRNGHTLDSLQFVLRQMCKSAQADQGPFIVDILDYRTRRRRTLEDQAKKGAVAVLNGDTERFALLPMSPYDRRLVHQYLQEHFADLASESEGQGPDRHIVISFKGIEKSGASDEEYDDESDFEAQDGDESEDKSK